MLTSGLAWRLLIKSGEKCTGASLENQCQLKMVNAAAPPERDAPDLRKTCSVVPLGVLEGPWPIVPGNVVY